MAGPRMNPMVWKSEKSAMWVVLSDSYVAFDRYVLHGALIPETNRFLSRASSGSLKSRKTSRLD